MTAVVDDPSGPAPEPERRGDPRPASRRDPGAIPELALSAAWNAQRFAGPLRTDDGRSVEVIHRGSWTHGFGPDFRDAMLLLDGQELLTGSVEVHLTTAAWRQHGHHRDPRYNDVILHVVGRHDESETRRQDGALVPVVQVARGDNGAWAGHRDADWSRVGGEVCAAELAQRRPTEIRAMLWGLGDVRLAAKTALIEARLSAAPPGEVLFEDLWDGLGFAANREPMVQLARRLTLAAVEGALATVDAQDRLSLARGLVFGVAGFLPIAPADAAAARLSPDAVATAEARWHTHGGPWGDQRLPATAWTRARVRPANHPALRLAAGAAMLAQVRGGLVAALLAPVRRGDDAVTALRDLSAWDGQPGLGADRAHGLVANALIPFALALAEHTGDTQLGDAAGGAWEHLPAAEANEITRRAHGQVAGSVRLPGLGARGQQGLIHLDTTLCQPRRCYECPIAHRVLFDSAADAE